MGHLIRINQSQYDDLIRSITIEYEIEKRLDKLKIFSEGEKKKIKKSLVELYDFLDLERRFYLGYIKVLKPSDAFKMIHERQSEVIEHIFKGDKKINETFKMLFPKNLLTESIEGIERTINLFSKFLYESVYKRALSEQRVKDLPQNKGQATPNFTNAGTAASAQRQANLNRVAAATSGTETGKAMTAANAPKQSWLDYATNYLKQKGVNFIFEQIRKALLSGVGTVIQAALSFTGVGAIAVEVVWAIMTLYDGYQWLVNGAPLINLVISSLCLLTAGYLGKVLGKYFGGVAAKNFPEVLAFFEKMGAGKLLSGSLNAIKTGASKLASLLKSALDFCVTKMNIKWLSGIFNRLIGFIEGTVIPSLEKWSSKFGSATGGVPKTIASGLGEKIANEIRKKIPGGKLAVAFAKLDQSVAQNWIGQKIRKETLPAVDKYVADVIKDNANETIETALTKVDKKFGQHYGDLFAFFLNVDKLRKDRQKIAGGEKFAASSVAADAARGKSTYEKSEKYADKSKKAVVAGLPSDTKLGQTVKSTVPQIAKAATTGRPQDITLF